MSFEGAGRSGRLMSRLFEPMEVSCGGLRRAGEAKGYFCSKTILQLMNLGTLGQERQIAPPIRSLEVHK